ncbi:acylphosphatase [Spiribacter insolitus]|uniref:acylphosphatase n=1 Tax=Spiribacter insolitus TaxID=3122417 RepID=A0ABV3T6V2_9GAMM
MNATSTPCRQFRIQGRVQGVFFRASTQDRARALGLRGWAENLPDGSVQVVACGDEQALNALSEWLWEGPASAEVTDVAASSIDDPGCRDFTTR